MYSPRICVDTATPAFWRTPRLDPDSRPRLQRISSTTWMRWTSTGPLSRAMTGGGRAACIAEALYPERIAGLVSVDGYNVQNLANAGEPSAPEWERTYWYQYYFQSERGRRGLDRNRDELCELLWRTWSPTWAGAAGAFPASAPSLHNSDFVDVVIHSYQHRFGLVSGDPQYQTIEDLIADEPTISVPTVVLEGGADGLGGPSATDDREYFTGPYQHQLLPGVGHNVPQEAPEAFAQAVTSLLH